jgi:hypothetical protein
VSAVAILEVPAPGAPAAGDARRRRRLAWSLVAVAPLVAEFVSGNLPVVYVWLLIVYAPLYGGAALLARELGRRSARPWPVIVTLGLAFGVFEEAFLSFSLFNPDYADLRLLDFGWIPSLGAGAWWTIFVVVLHAVWSVCVPIVLVEAFAAEVAERPWLTNRALAVPGVAVALGAGATLAVTRAEDAFVPSAGQLVGAALVLGALVAAAVVFATRPTRARRTASAHVAPTPVRVAGLSALAATAFYATAAQVGPWAVTVALLLVLLVGAVVVIRRWSIAAGWSARHRLALAAGALVPHVAFAALQRSLVEVPLVVDLAGDAVFGAGVTALVVLSWRRLAPAHPDRPAR